jgi:hypothetical protein
MYYTMIGSFILIVVGMIVSLLTKPPDIQDMNPDLFAPFLRKYVMRLKEKESKNYSAEMEVLNIPPQKKGSLKEEH